MRELKQDDCELLEKLSRFLLVYLHIEQDKRAYLGIEPSSSAARWGEDREGSWSGDDVKAPGGRVCFLSADR